MESNNSLAGLGFRRARKFGVTKTAPGGLGSGRSGSSRNPFQRAVSLDSTTNKPFRLPSFAKCTDTADNSDESCSMSPAELEEPSVPVLHASPARNPLSELHKEDDVGKQPKTPDFSPQRSPQKSPQKTPQKSLDLPRMPSILPKSARKLFVPVEKDWSLRCEATFTSRSSFAWIKYSPPEDESHAMMSFLSNASEMKNSPHQALLYWIHPASQSCPVVSDQIVLAASRKRSHESLSGDDQRLLQYQSQQVTDWRNSLRSVYYMLRHGVCPYFYVRCSAYSVLFYAENSSCHAVLTRSTKGLRAMLTEEGVPFKMPLAENGDVESIAKDKEDEDPTMSNEDELISAGVESIRRRRMESKLQSSPQSILTFDGHVGIHGLFNVLYTMPREEDRKLPELLAPVGFLNACVKTIQVTQNSVMQQVSGSTQLETLHVFSIRGPIMPNCLKQLQQLFRTRSQNTDASCTWKAEPTDVIPIPVGDDQAT